MDVARKNTVTRIKRCCTIMGRQEGDDNVSSAQIFYPCMQCADVFFLKVCFVWVRCIAYLSCILKHSIHLMCIYNVHALTP